MASSSTKRQKTRKGKVVVDDAPIATIEPMRIEDVLDYLWYFSLKH